MLGPLVGDLVQRATGDGRRGAAGARAQALASLCVRPADRRSAAYPRLRSRRTHPAADLTRALSLEARGTFHAVSSAFPHGDDDKLPVRLLHDRVLVKLDGEAGSGARRAALSSRRLR